MTNAKKSSVAQQAMDKSLSLAQAILLTARTKCGSEGIATKVLQEPVRISLPQHNTPPNSSHALAKGSFGGVHSSIGQCNSEVTILQQRETSTVLLPPASRTKSQGFHPGGLTKSQATKTKMATPSACRNLVHTRTVGEVCLALSLTNVRNHVQPRWPSHGWAKHFLLHSFLSICDCAGI